MSKLLALAAVPVVAGLVVWNLTLASDVADLRAQLDGRADAPHVKPDAPKAPGASAEPRPRETGRANPQVTELVDRVVLLEKQLRERPAVAAPGAPEAVSSGSDEPYTGAFASEEFKAAVDRVLDDRDLAKKREQIEKRAEGMTRIWLHSANVGPEQTKQVVAVVFASLEKQALIRDDQTITDDQRRADYAVLDQQRQDQIAAILDAQQMEIVGPRLVQRTRIPVAQTPEQAPTPPTKRRAIMRPGPGRTQPGEDEKKDE